MCGRPRNSPRDERRIDEALIFSRRRSNRKSATGLMGHIVPPRCCFLVAVRHAEAGNRGRPPSYCQRGRRTQGEELRGRRHPCDLDRLPLSDDTRVAARQLAASYQSSLNEDYPPDLSPWPRQQQAAFNEAARNLLTTLRNELEPRWTVEDHYDPFPVPNRADTSE